MKRAYCAAASSAASSVSPPTLSQYLEDDQKTTFTMDRKCGIHVDRALLCENLGRLGSLVIEHDVCPDFLHERDFVV